MVSFIPSRKILWRLGLVFSAAALLSLSYFRAFDLYELQTYDWRFQLRGPRPVSKDIVLIDIWNDTLEALGAWPIDRAYHATLIEALSAYDVKAVGFDTLFAEPRKGDADVIRAARQAENVYFVYAFHDPQPDKSSFSSDTLIAPLLDSYKDAGKGSGFVNTRADIDGKRRRTIPIIEYKGQTYYQLSFQIAMDALGVKKEDVKIHPGKDIEFSKDFRVPIDDEGCFIVNYAGLWEKTFKHYSYLDILASYAQVMQGQKPRIDLNELKGKICFVGLTSLGSHDTSPIPIQSVYPMVGSYANVLNGILQKDFIHRLDRVSNLLVILIFAAAILFISFRLKPLVALFSTLLVLAGFMMSAILSFGFAGWWIDLFYPFMLFVLIYAAATLTRTVLEMRKRELIESELKIASQIQKSFLPESLPQEKGISVAVYMQPAKAVGGDLYAFISPGPSKLGVMVGDVSGKGTPAALFMAKTVSEFKFSARDKTDPAQVLVALNDSIASESTGGLFVTLTYVIFDLERRKFMLSNGGHLPVVRTRAGGPADFITADEGMPIGVLGGTAFANAEGDLAPGDCFALYSDGISEARNRKKDEYSAELLMKTLDQFKNLSAQEILDETVKGVQRFVGKADPHDDMTLIVVKIEAVS